MIITHLLCIEPSRENDVLVSNILENGFFLVVQNDQDIVQVGPLRDLLSRAARDDDRCASQARQNKDDKEIAYEMHCHQMLANRGRLNRDNRWS